MRFCVLGLIGSVPLPLREGLQDPVRILSDLAILWTFYILHILP